MLEKMIVSLLILLVPGAVCAAPVMDPLRIADIRRDVTYCTVDGNALKMDIYSPKAAGQGPFPAAVYVHGGGWQKGNKSSGAGFQFIPELVSRGYVVFSIDYRLAPQHKFPAQIEDAKCAIRHIRANAGQYKIDPKLIGVFGGSAGGHLVSLLGLTTPKDGFEGKGGYMDHSSSVQAVVDLFGPTDLTDCFPVGKGHFSDVVFGVTDSDSPLLKKASPLTYVHKDAPPFLIIHGDKDKTVPLQQSERLYEKLKAVGVDATLVVVRNAGHGFHPASGDLSPTMPNIVDKAANFFDKHLKGKK